MTGEYLLVDAEHHDHAMATRRRSDRLGHRAGHHHGILIEADMLGAGENRRRDRAAERGRTRYSQR